MESMTHIKLCHLYIAALDNEGLYSTNSVLRHAQMSGLPIESQGKGVTAHLNELASLLSSSIMKKSELESDGIDQMDHGHPTCAFLGIRWKTAIPKKELSEADQEIAHQFAADDNFDSLFLFQKPIRKYSWREVAKDVMASSRDKRKIIPISIELPIALSLILVFSLFLWLTVLWDASNKPVDHHLTSNDNTKTLRSLLQNETMSSSQGKMLPGATNDPSPDEGILVISDGMDGIQAVFAFEISPVILFESVIVQLGDLVTIGDDSGYVQDIGSRSLVLKTGAGLRELEYPILRIFGRQNWHTTQVSIYPHGNNMRRILAMVSQITNRKLELQEDVKSKQTDIFHGAIVGSFHCDSYEEFLGNVRVDLGVLIGRDTIRFTPFAPERLRTCIGFDFHFAFFQSTIKEIFHEYEMLFGLELVTKTDRLNYDVIFPPKQFHDFVNEGRFKINSQGTNVFTIGDNK